MEVTMQASGNMSLVANLPPPHAWQAMPLLKPTYTAYEDSFRNKNILTWMRMNSYVPIAIVACYILLVFVGQRVMKNRAPFHLVGALAYWNLALSIFSFIGAFRTVPVVFNLLSTIGVERTMCTDVKNLYWSEHATGVWTCAFILSKIPELVDTIFIVLRKKPLIFLHWYHHATVLLYCWHSYVVQSPSGIPFVAMNYSVHALMYLYYFAKAKRLKFIDVVPPMSITGAQLLQMVGGIYFCALSLYYVTTRGNECAVNDKTSIYMGLAMYFSYFVLFANFFLQRYVFKKNKAGQVAVTAKKSE